MGNQEAFDLIIAHLLKQKKRALDEHGLCSYRTMDGAMCAVGYLIQDIELTPAQNNSCVRDLFTESLEVQALFKEVDLRFLEDMQNLHDEATYYEQGGFTTAGKTKIKTIARDYHLNAPEQA